MSKKNNLATRQRHHEARLAREQQQAAAKQKKAASKAETLPQAKVSKKPAKRKLRGIRIRKGVTIKGIKVTDAETKRKAIDALKADQAVKEMQREEFDVSRLNLHGADEME